jgi:hypothetical protein
MWPELAKRKLTVRKLTVREFAVATVQLVWWQTKCGAPNGLEA